MKKNLMTVVILALLVVNIILTSVMMFSVMGTNKKTADLVGNIATALNLELTVPGQEEVPAEISVADTAIYDIDGELMIPLAADPAVADGQDHYVMFSIAFSLDKKSKDYKKYGETMAEWKSMLLDIINTIVSSHTEAEIRNDMEGLKAEILQAVQERFDSDFIYKVAISGVKFQ